MHFFLKVFFFFIVTSSIQVAFSDDKSIYNFKWLDDDEIVYVIQDKEHIKAGNFGVDLSFASSNNSPYQQTNGFFGSLTYYFSENWSMDYTYKKYNNSDSVDLENLLKAFDVEGVKPIIRRVNSAQLIHVNWIPFYGKINTFNQTLFFDWGLGLGFGQFETEGNYKTFLIKNKRITYEQESDIGFSFRSYVKFYTRSRINMGFEYNLMGVDTIRDPDGKKDILYYTDLAATVGYLF